MIIPHFQIAVKPKNADFLIYNPYSLVFSLFFSFLLIFSFFISKFKNGDKHRENRVLSPFFDHFRNPLCPMMSATSASSSGGSTSANRT